MYQFGSPVQDAKGIAEPVSLEEGFDRETGAAKKKRHSLVRNVCIGGGGGRPKGTGRIMMWERKIMEGFEGCA